MVAIFRFNYTIYCIETDNIFDLIGNASVSMVTVWRVLVGEKPALERKTI